MSKTTKFLEISPNLSPGDVDPADVIDLKDVSVAALEETWNELPGGIQGSKSKKADVSPLFWAATRGQWYDVDTYNNLLYRL